MQAYSQGRRDLLQPGGPGNAKPYAEADFVLGLGPLVASARPTVEDRLQDDPDYRPQYPIADFKQVYRFVEGYAAMRWKWGGLHFGQLQHNWGPAGLVGIPIGNYGYPRNGFGFWLGNRDHPGRRDHRAFAGRGG